jgi:GNAT superfamily N-acetyltransferase
VTGADFEVRRALPDDLPGILAVARQSLGWVGGDEDARFFHWKHHESPFGESPMWVALDGTRVIGLRTFLRWQLEWPDGSSVAAVRAVDTATDPAHRGRGIFTRLTTQAIEELRAEGVDLVFNTPNQQSLPGYLKMGWSVVGRLGAAIMLTRAGSLLSLASARRPASQSAVETRVGEPAADVFVDRGAIEDLLAMQPHRSGLATLRSPAFLAWRYGYKPLGYRVFLSPTSPVDGLAVFRLRHRGNAIEAAVCDVLVPRGDPAKVRVLMRGLARVTGADYLIRLSHVFASPGPFIRVPRVGPMLTCRPLHDHQVPRLAQWDLSMGDVEML